jgi:hypothetical protein
MSPIILLKRSSIFFYHHSAALEAVMENNRIAQRSRVLRGAVISFRQLGTTIDCTVHNLSNTGACLMVTSPVGIPSEFELVPNRDKVPRHCRVVWRAADRIGVGFE